MNTIFQNRILINKNLTVFAGGFFCAYIYFFYRGESIIFNQILSTFQWDTIFCKDLISSKFPLPSWAVYSLPGGIWVLVLSGMLRNHHITIFNKQLPLHYLPIVYGILLEFLQFLHWTDGTFDWMDILFLCSGSMLSKRTENTVISVPFSWKFTLQNTLIFSGFVVLILSDVSNV